jgi:integrase
VLTTSGGFKRTYVYGRSREEVHARLVQLQDKSARGIPRPSKDWKRGSTWTTGWPRLPSQPSGRPHTRSTRSWFGCTCGRALDGTGWTGFRWPPCRLLLYGLRRGEVLGLSWRAVDFDKGSIRIEQQLFRAANRLQLGPVKTAAADARRSSGSTGSSGRAHGDLLLSLLLSSQQNAPRRVKTAADPRIKGRRGHV